MKHRAVRVALIYEFIVRFRRLNDRRESRARALAAGAGCRGGASDAWRERSRSDVRVSDNDRRVVEVDRRRRE